MATQVQFRRGTTAQNNSFTGAAGEITINTTNDSIRVHDGSTQGGGELAKTDLSNHASVGILTATTFSGNLTGNVTGNADTATTSTNVTVADESSDTTCFPLFATAATGNLPPKSGTNLTFNSSSGQLTATSFSGDGSALTGIDATSIKDSNGTVRAQANTSGVVVTGIATATTFVGALTGNVTGNSTGTHTGAVDLNGGVLTLDADADTTITADTDDQIDIAFGGSDRITLSPGLIDLKNNGSQSALRLYCEVSNAHYASLQAPAHSDFSGNITLTLPAATDTLVGRTATQTLTNKTLTSPTITGTGAIAGAFTGDVTGDVTGNLTGNVTGNVSGTAGGLSGTPSITVASITATGDLSVAGTLTYEDVTSVDALGIGTFRTGVRVTSGGIVEGAGGITGTHVNVSGIVTANSFRGDGSNLTGISASGVGAIGGLTVKNQSGTVVGTAGSVATLDFNGSSGVSVIASDGAAGIATIAIIPQVVNDTTPQLGGDLDLNSSDITGTGNLNITGNIALSGTVDGRDVATDGTKLDGIEASATADQTAAEIRTLVESASDSNVFTDADHSKLNGIASGATNVTNNNQLTNGAGYVTANTQLSNEQVQDIVGGMVSSNSESGITVTYQDSDGTIDFSVASQTDNNFTNSDHSKLDGIESGATADQTASEILTLIKTVDGSGSGLDADTLDGISSGSFLRSDASDSASGELTFNGRVNIRGHIDLSDNEYLYFGSGDDVEMFCNGSHMYMDLNSGIGNFYIRDGSTTRFTFDDAGHFTATGNINSSSDVRLKTNIRPLEKTLEKVTKLRGVKYDRVDIESDNCIGVIAQEVEEVYPEFVNEGDDGMKGVDYSKMVAVLIEAVKEQQQQINDLKNEIKSLKG